MSSEKTFVNCGHQSLPSFPLHLLALPRDRWYFFLADSFRGVSAWLHESRPESRARTTRVRAQLDEHVQTVSLSEQGRHSQGERVSCTSALTSENTCTAQFRGQHLCQGTNRGERIPNPVQRGTLTRHTTWAPQHPVAAEVYLTKMPLAFASDNDIVALCGSRCTTGFLFRSLLMYSRRYSEVLAMGLLFDFNDAMRWPGVSFNRPVSRRAERLSIL